MPKMYQRLVVTATSTPLLSGNAKHFARETELLFGEEANLLEEVGRHYLVTTESYSMPGYVLKDAVRVLSRGRTASYTHRVKVITATLYEKASFKAPDLLGRSLALNARVRCTAHAGSPEGDMSFIEGLGWIFSDQIIKRHEFLTDYVDTALKYVGPASAYAWGGRVPPDCSALVQQALIAAGIPCPRNAGEQSKSLGIEVDMQDPDFKLKRGDFVFWTAIPGKSRHVAIMVDWDNCVHASIAPPRHTMLQKLQDVIAHQREGGNGDSNVVRRFPNRP